MGDRLISREQRLLIRFRKACRWLWGVPLALFWVGLGTLGLFVLLPAAVNIGSSLLTSTWPPPNFDRTLLGRALPYAIYPVASLIILLLITAIIYLGSYLDIGIPETVDEQPIIDERVLGKKMKQRYLDYIIRETETMHFKGIIASLHPKSVKLDEVFVPLQFLPCAGMQHNAMPVQAMEKRGQIAQRKRSQDRTESTSIADILGELTVRQPAAVIQGFPGMGKSTLLARLSLYMARGCLGVDDSMSGSLEPRIPIFLDLGEYARRLEKNLHLSLMDYLMQAHKWRHLGVFRVAPFLQKCLRIRWCLVLLDGLDEVPEKQMREQVQESIETFISQCNGSDKKKHFNRFLITSRISGYDSLVFHHYPHYQIAPLTDERINDFWERWFAAAGAPEQSLVESEGGKKARDVQDPVDDIKDHPGMRTLAENPLLLTLLAVMKQQHISLPGQRVELYQGVIHILLAKGHNVENLLASEAQILRRLSFLAHIMQENKEDFLPHQEMLNILDQAIREAENSTVNHSVEEANNLFEHLKVGGLFVRRSDDYFGFMHRSFQEYFAGHHLFNQLLRHPTDENVEKFVLKARLPDDSWREPCLFAMGYLGYQASRNNRDMSLGPKAASLTKKIINRLLNMPQETDDPEHDLLLAAECVIEARPAVIDSGLQQHIARELLDVYEEKLRKQQFEMCENIENALRRWLLNLGEYPRPPLLIVLEATILNAESVARQYATLTLLVMVAKQLASCPRIVFNTLIPPLRKLAGLPEEGQDDHRVTHPLLPDLTAADLALTVLSFMGKEGPAGTLLQVVRQYFQKHPEQLDTLARYSLESDLLLTPIVVPQEKQNYQKYHALVRQWLLLSRRHKESPDTGADIKECVEIHERLLSCAEEVRYPTAKHLLKVLQQVDDAGRSWQQISQDFQTFLASQLASGFYDRFLEVVILWATLFPEKASLEDLVDLLLNHYRSDKTKPAHRYVRHLLAAFNDSAQVQQNLRYVRDVLDVLDWIELPDISYVDLKDEPLDRLYLGDSNAPISVLQRLRYQRSFPYLRECRETQNMYMSLRLPDLRELLPPLFTPEVTTEIAGITSAHLTPAALVTDNLEENLDLLWILRGLIYRIKVDYMVGTMVERVVEIIVQAVEAYFLLVTNDQCRTIMLEIIRNLPVRSAREIEIVLQLWQETSCEPIKQACVDALNIHKDSRQLHREARAALEAAIKFTEQSSLVSREDIPEILLAIENESFHDYHRLAKAIIRCMEATDPLLIESPYFDSGTVWEISLPVFGLQLRTQETILLLRQREYGRASYEHLIEIQQEKDAAFIMIIDIMDVPSSPMPITSRTVRFRPESLKEMITTPKGAFLRWLGRFITTQVDVKLLLPYQTHGAATNLFFGREDELARLTGGKLRGGIIIGAHRSGKTSLLHRLGERLKQRGLKVVDPIIFTGEEFQSFFESTLLPLSLDCREGMTPGFWASTLRAYSKKQGKSPVFLLDEVDALLALDAKEGLTLGRQMRSLQNDGLCEFYLAGHKMLRQAIRLEEGPLRNFAEEIILTGLTEPASIRLIQEPIEKIGFSVNNNQAERIYKGTAGVAVLIQEFCILLLCGRFHYEVYQEIEDTAIETIERSPDYLNVVFDHFVYGQGWIEISVMLITAIYKEVTRQDILQEFNEHCLAVRRNLLDTALGFLVNFGVLAEFKPGHYSILSTYLYDAIMTRDPLSLLEDEIEEGKKKSNYD